MTDLRTAAQQALEALEDFKRRGHWGDFDNLTGALKAALAEYDKDRVKVEEMKANWALQRKLAEETQERDRQQREYEEQRLAALAEPVQTPHMYPLQSERMRIDPVTGDVSIGTPSAEPVQKPVAWFHTDFGSLELSRVQRVGWKPLYTAPPQRKPLTEGEISNIWDGHVVPVFGKNGINPVVFARAIERAHGIGGQP